MKKVISVFVVLVILFVAMQVFAQDMIGTTVVSITTTSMAGEMSQVTDAAGNSVFEGSAFTIDFQGLTEMIVGFELDGMMHVSTEGAIPATLHIRRNPDTDTREVAWYQGSVNTSNSTIIVATAGPASAHDLLSGNNLLNGVDNVFVNEGAAAGEVVFQGNQSIERLDYILASSVMAGDDTGFVVFERGPLSAGHDGFGIAAITGLDADGNPSAFGALYQITGWGTTILAQIPPYLVFSNGADGMGGAPTSLTLLSSTQVMGGIFFRTAELVDAGTEVFGYALVGPDVTCTAEELVDIMAACYPTNTGNPGGLDFPNVNLGALMVGN